MAGPVDPWARMEADLATPTAGRAPAAVDPWARMEADLSTDPYYIPWNPKPEVGILESAVRGGAQGLTVNSADEITGAFEAAIDQIGGAKESLAASYRKRRDESRAAYDQAREDNPIAYGASEIGGSIAGALVPGVGAARGATAVATAGRAAVQGGAAALGATRADLTKGEFVEAGKDVLEGAAYGGAGGVVVDKAMRMGGKLLGSKVLGGDKVAAASRERAAKKLAEAQKEGGEALAEAEIKFGPLAAADDAVAAKASVDPRAAHAAAADSMRDTAIQNLEFAAGNRVKMKAFGREGVARPKIERVVGADKELQVALGESYDDAMKITRERLKDRGTKVDAEVYDVASQHTDGAKMGAVATPLAELERKLAGRTATAPLAKIVKKEAAAFFKLHGSENGGRIPLQVLREEYRGWQDVAFKSRSALGEVSPRLQVAEDMANIMRTALHEEVEAVAKANPSLGPLREKLTAFNEEISAYKGIESVLSEALTRKGAAAPTMGEMLSPLKDIRRGLQEKVRDGGLDVLGGMRSISLRAKASASDRAAGAATAEPAKAANDNAAAAFARYVAALKAGRNSADLAAQAISQGVPKATVEGIARKYGGEKKDDKRGRN